MNTRERIILAILAGLNFTHFLDFMIMLPLGSVLMGHFNVSTEHFSLLVSAYSLSAFVSGIVAALVIDHFDRKKVLLVSYIGFLAGTAACGFAEGYWFLLAARVMAGTFGGIIGAQIMAIVADLFEYERRGQAMGVVVSSFAVALIFGVPFSQYLTQLFDGNWHAPFLMISGVGVLLTPFLFRFLPAMRGHILNKSDRQGTLREMVLLLQMSPARNALIFSCVLMIGHFLLIPFIVPFLELNMGFSDEQTPMIYLVGGLAALGSAFLLGRISDKRGKLPVFQVSVFLSLFMAFLIARMPDVPFTLVLLFFAVWFVLAVGRAVSAQAMITEMVPPEKRGRFMSFNGSVQQLGTGLASVAAGLIVYKDNTGRIQHFDWLGYASIVVLIISLLLGRYLFRDLDNDALAVDTAATTPREGESI